MFHVIEGRKGSFYHVNLIIILEKDNVLDLKLLCNECLLVDKLKYIYFSDTAKTKYRIQFFNLTTKYFKTLNVPGA